MSFEAVTESLLKGGIAPRHVRRYVGELTDHLADLTERQRASGYDGEDAHLRARALLGDDRELTAAMLEQKRFRSWPARLPWLVFVPLPFIGLTIAMVALTFPIFFIGDGAAHITRMTAIPPDLLRAVSRGGLAGLNMLALPLLAAALLLAAHRQRLTLFWPLTGIVLLLLCFPHSAMDFADGVAHKTGSVRFNFAPLFLPAFTGEFAKHGGVVAMQWLLTALSVVWLLRRRRVCAGA
jgi:hypothetical protein